MLTLVSPWVGMGGEIGIIVEEKGRSATRRTERLARIPKRLKGAKRDSESRSTFGGKLAMEALMKRPVAGHRACSGIVSRSVAVVGLETARKKTDPSLTSGESWAGMCAPSRFVTFRGV